MLAKDTPVARLKAVPIDRLEQLQDWDLLEAPEPALLDVPAGTVQQLLREISEENLWDQLYLLAEERPEQWMLDLSHFFAKEEAFVEPLVSFLMRAKTLHVKVCFAQDADEWPWGENSIHLIPEVIQFISCLREEIDGGDYHVAGPTLEKVCAALSERAAKSLQAAGQGI